MRNNFCSFQILMLLFTFSRKNLSYLFFHCHLNNARNSCAPFIESLFPPEKFLHGNILPLKSPLNSPPPNLKIPLKTSLHFPITITINITINTGQTSNFVTCSPSHRDCGGIIRPQRHSY